MNKIALCFYLVVVLQANAFIDASLQMQLGNPSNATADSNNHSHYLILRSIEALDYNDSRGQPNWASWDLTSGDANGAVVRQDSFSADASLPANFYEVPASAYSGSGFDRGHLCPSADRTDSTNDNDMTFLMSNMMPQSPQNNEVTWKGLEDYCRSLADFGNEVLIICGPSGFDGSHISSNPNVLIPSNTWKIAVIVPLGSGTALSRITTTTNRVISVLIPNTAPISSGWSSYVTSAHQIELETGLSFFTALPGPIASAFRAKIDNLASLPPPAITNFIPASGPVNSTIVISGTNFTGTSAVKFNGTDAVFTVYSNTQISTLVPTNATTGSISVTTPSGSVSSTNIFTISNSNLPPGDLAATSTHSANFTQGDLADTLTITVVNSGAGPTSGDVIVTNTLPPGLTAEAISGSGWITSLPSLTATRSDPLGAGLAYPSINIMVKVATNAPEIVTNTAWVFGGGETNLANNSTSDLISIQARTNTASFGKIVTLVGWDVSGQSGFGISPFLPTTNATGLTVTGLTRGSGVTTSGNSAAGAWGGTDWTSSTSSTAILNHDFVFFSLGPQSGYNVSFTNINRFDYRRSTTGPSQGLLQYQLNSGAFNDIATVTYDTDSSSGASIGNLDLSAITELQNVGSGTNVTFRIVNYGASSYAGTWYIFDRGSSTALDFSIQGVVNQIPATPILSLPAITNNQFRFTVTGTPGFNYAVETSTDFSNWFAVATNLSPFSFSDTFPPVSPFRLFRARLIP